MINLVGVRIWCSLGKNDFISIPLVIFLGGLSRGSADQLLGPGPLAGSVDQGSVFSGHPFSGAAASVNKSNIPSFPKNNPLLVIEHIYRNFTLHHLLPPRNIHEYNLRHKRNFALHRIGTNRFKNTSIPAMSKSHV